MASEVALNRTVTINSIVAPQHFYLGSPITMLCETAVEEGLIVEWNQIMSSLNGARLAYNLDTCEGFGLAADDKKCDINGFNYVLIINYDQERLSLTMMDIQLYTFEYHLVTHYPRYGEKRGGIVRLYPMLCHSINKQRDWYSSW